MFCLAASDRGVGVGVPSDAKRRYCWVTRIVLWFYLLSAFDADHVER